MKKKHIKQILRSEIESHVPKSAPKIGFPFVVAQSRPIEKKRFAFKLKFVMTTALATLMVVVIIALWSGPIEPSVPNKLLKTDNEIISFSAVSSISLMSTFGANEQISQQSLVTVSNQPPFVRYVMPYLRAVEQLLLSEQGLNLVSGASELPEYTDFILFETKDLLGNITSYIMHYNMLLIEADDDEFEYELEGILIFGSQTYDVIGEKTIEDDEEKVRFKAFKDSKNYVESIYEIEDDKQIFEFKVVQNDLVISESKFEIEYDGDEIIVQLEFQEGINEGEFEFEFFTENGINLIKIEFETKINGVRTSGEMTVEMFIDPISGSIKYRIYIDTDGEEAYEYEIEQDDETEDEDVSEPDPTDDEDEDVSEPDPTEDEDDE